MVIGNQLVVADFEGYVHVLDIATGEFSARGKSGGARVSNAPVVADGLVLVMNDEGHLTAFRVAPRASRG